MKEERVFFMAGNVKIEGLYGASGGERGVVITHPHPQMGGSMSNNVVEALMEGYSHKGFSTLRFNFRGVGRSGGFYDNGNGEQDDVMGAFAFLRERKKSDIVLAGYSFGAWIIAKVLTHQDQFSDVVLISPPIDFVDFDFSGLEGRIGLIICGDRDQFCPLEKLKGIVNSIKCQFSVVQGTDHFYWGREGGIVEYLDGYLKL
jgi:alpha/beta superfamily hydrolase